MTKIVLKADYIIISSQEQYENAYIAIDNNKIIDISEKYLSKFKDYKYIDYSGHIIMPGLIDAHIHSYQVGNRGRNVKKSLLDWLNTHILPWESNLTPIKARISALLAYSEMIESGTTTFSDFTSVNHVEEAFKAASQLGIRAFIGKTMMDFNAPDGLLETTENAINDSIRIMENWHNHNNGRLNFVLTPRFDLTCSNELFKKSVEVSNKYDLLMQTHVQETKGELAFEMEHYGKHAIKHLNDLGFITSKTLLAHCVWMDDEDFEIIKKTDSSVVHNPGSNMMLNSGVANIPKMIKEGINVAIGSDVVAYHNFNLFEQGRLTYNMHLLNSGFSALTPKDVFDMLTINGAKALNIDDKVGTLEIGKEADLIVGKLRTHHYPIANIIDNIILTFNKDDIVSAMVAGEFIYKDKKISFDKEKLLEDIKKFLK